MAKLLDWYEVNTSEKLIFCFMWHPKADKKLFCGAIRKWQDSPERRVKCELDIKALCRAGGFNPIELVSVPETEKIAGLTKL